jgi:hypothetical protein
MAGVLNDGSPFGFELAAYNSPIKQIKKSGNLSARPLDADGRTAPDPIGPGMDAPFMVDSQQLLMHFYRPAFATDKNKKMGAGLLLSDIHFGLRNYLAGGSDDQITLICGHTL